MRVYIYCTQAKPYLRLNSHNGIYYTYDTIPTDNDLNGKIVASFELNRVEKIENDRFNSLKWESIQEFEIGNQIAVEQTGLCFSEMEIYANGKDLYEWYIKDLKILDKSLKLSDFYQRCKCYEKGCNDSNCLLYETPGYEYNEVDNDCEGLKPITKAPQSWQYAYRIIGHDKYNYCSKTESCILIATKPELVAKILNGEKIIEIRKTYPKEIVWR